jgi:two-component system response regulator NreC
MDKIKIFLADDHEILREGLKLILEKVPRYEIIGESGNGRDALEKIEQLQPDLVILDISMPGMTGIEVTTQIKKYNPQISVIALSRHDSVEYLNKLLKSGANGYIHKSEAGRALLSGIEAVLNGDTYLCPKMTSMLVSDYITPMDIKKKSKGMDSFTQLTEREKVILKLIAEGKSSKEIASALWISPETVKVHRSNIRKKLKIKKVADLVTYAIKNGILEL